MILCDENSPAMRYFRIFVIFLVFGYSLVSMILSITAYTSLSENVTVIVDTIDNWKTGTINDIAISDDGNCNDGYELAYNFWWPGTSSGCDCTSAVTQSFQNIGFRSGTCNSTEISKGCVTSPAYGAVQLTSWGSISSVAKGICIQRTTENFAEKGPNQGVVCNSGELQCGIDPDYLFCTAESQCPVTSVEIVGASCATCVQLDDGKYLKINRGEEKLPLVEFRVNEHGMCNEADHVSRTPGRSYYKFIRSTGYGCDGEGNDLWNVLDQLGEDELFDLNGLTSKISSLSAFGYYDPGTSGADFTYYLVDRGYVPFRFQCRSNMDNVINNLTHFEDIKSSHLALLIVSVISFLVLGIFLPLMEVLNLCGKDLPFFDGSGSSERRRILNCKRILYYFFKLIMLPFQIWAINSLSKTKDLITYVSGDNCSTPYMNKLIERTADSFSQALSNDITAIALLGALFLFSLIGFCRKREDNDNNSGSSSRRRNNKVQDLDESAINNSNRALNQTLEPNHYGNQQFQQQPIIQQGQPYHQRPNNHQQFQQPYQQTPGYVQQQQPGFIQQGQFQGQTQGQPQGQTITIKIDQTAIQNQ